jgi:2-polyprenyl-3-methyl-5-hydroxy-6-metoxy-1,4-benzoquinol methylase
MHSLSAHDSMTAAIGGRRELDARINRPAFTNKLAVDWLAAMPDVVARLEAARHARVADVGCGQGFSTLAVAKAFLGAHVDGLDLDPASIEDARRHAREAGLDGRVRFIEADATDLAGRGPYDLILVLEALHDMARPRQALAAARAALADGGTLLVADERVADQFTAAGDELASEAGFARLDVLAGENDFFRLCRLDPQPPTTNRRSSPAQGGRA